LLLLQISIFLGELHHCASVTYHLSNDECKGSNLDNKCKGTGEQLARITDLASLDIAKQAITNQGIKYWTGLRYHKSKGYCWKRDDDDDDDEDDEDDDEKEEEEDDHGHCNDPSCINVPLSLTTSAMMTVKEVT